MIMTYSKNNRGNIMKQQKSPDSPKVSQWAFFHATQLTPVQVGQHAIEEITIALGFDAEGQIARAIIQPRTQNNP